MKRWLPWNIIKCNGVGGQRVEVKGGGQGGTSRKKGTLEDLRILNKRREKGSALRKENNVSCGEENGDKIDTSGRRQESESQKQSEQSNGKLYNRHQTIDSQDKYFNA